MNRFSRNFVVAALGMAALATATQAASVLNFVPNPNDSTPEFQFNKRGSDTVPSFYEAAGAIGNGDGNAAIQTAPGLQLTTGFTFAYAPLRGQDIVDNHIFDDATLHLTGFQADGFAGLSGTTVVQALTNGTFTILATNGEVLLTGTATDATITAKNGTGTGSTFSSTVTYTGGSFLPFIAGPTGEFSFSDLNITPAVTFTAGQYMADFTANGTGDFTAEPGTTVPVPAAVWGGMGLLGLLASTKFARRRAL